LIVIVAQVFSPKVPNSTEKTPLRVVRAICVAVSVSVAAVTRTRSRSLKCTPFTVNGDLSTS